MNQSVWFLLISHHLLSISDAWWGCKTGGFSKSAVGQVIRCQLIYNLRIPRLRHTLWLASPSRIKPLSILQMPEIRKILILKGSKPKVECSSYFTYHIEAECLRSPAMKLMSLQEYLLYGTLDKILQIITVYLQDQPAQCPKCKFTV